MSFENLGIKIPTILLPKAGIEMTKWAVVACDQYTSQREYWESVKKFIGTNPSTFNIIFPEVYLEDKDGEDRIKNINKNMEKYLNNKILVEQKPGFVYVDRKTEHAESRKGLVVALDLENYDFNKGSKTLIRATEGTIIERLPPRIKIRKNAPIELPHIMVLIDDPNNTVISPLEKVTGQLTKLYDFELMMNSGHITGYLIDDQKILKQIETALVKILENTKKQYDESMLFAMGDGNHSLATAKAIWEELKKNGAKMDNPARYALVELVNVHDPGLEFEPIHRVVFNVKMDFFEEMKKFYIQMGSECDLECKTNKAKIHTIPFLFEGKKQTLAVINPKLNLTVGTLQSFLDHYIKKNPQVKIDYIHGDDVVEKLGKQKNTIGFYLPSMEKTDLFKTVILDGALPRKTFSMGDASEKRFYIECRKIK